VNGTAEKKNHWSPRISLEPGSENILCKNLVDPKTILLPPLYIKLSIMKQFGKALKKLKIASSDFAKRFLIFRRSN
jgi:hypothetical protein